MAGRYCEGKIKMASEKVSRKMVLEIEYVNANNAVLYTENSKLLLDLNCKLVTGILAKISLGTGIWAKFRLGTGIWYPPSRPSNELVVLNEKCVVEEVKEVELRSRHGKFIYNRTNN